MLVNVSYITTYIATSAVLVSKLILVLVLVFTKITFRFWYTYGIAKVLFLDFSFSVGIDILQLIFNLQLHSYLKKTTFGISK